MINFLSSCVKNLSLAIIVVSILEMLLPNNKTKKYIKMVMGLYILFSIISPIISNFSEFDLNNIDLNTYVEETKVASSSEVVNQDSMDVRLNQIYKQELEKDITEKLEEKGYIIENCEVNCSIKDSNSQIEKIILKLSKNKDNNEIESIESRLVTEIQKVQKVQVKVDESETEEEKTSNLTKTDIEEIKNFLTNEYGVSEKCLKIN